LSKTEKNNLIIFKIIELFHHNTRTKGVEEAVSIIEVRIPSSSMRYTLKKGRLAYAESIGNCRSW
jgi:hypothetical protein